MNQIYKPIKPITGRKGGQYSAPRSPQEQPDTLTSKAIGRVLDLISEGEIEGLVDGAKSIYLNDTPLIASDDSPNFEGVQFWERKGLPGFAQEPIPGFDSVENEVSVNLQIKKTAPVTRTISNLGVNRIRIRFQIPQMYQQLSNGDVAGSGVQIKISVRKDGGSFQEYLQDSVNGKTRSAWEKNYEIILDKDTGPWDIKMERLTDDNTSSKMANDTFWISYTELVDSKFNYADSAVIGLIIDAEKFGNQVPTRAYDIKGLKVKIPANYDPIARTYTGIWDGSFITAWTDNPAWCLYDILINAKHGLGKFISPSMVEATDFYIAGQYCDELIDDGFGSTEPRYTLNCVLQTREDAFKVIGTLASVFQGMPYLSSGSIKISQDRPRDIDKLVTRSNVIAGEFTYTGTALQARHSAAKVTYNDPNDSYNQAIEVVEDPIAIDRYGAIDNDIVAFGCTSQGQAHRLGRWVLDTEQHSTDTVQYKAGLDHQDVRPGHILAVQDPAYAGIRLGGRITAIGPLLDPDHSPAVDRAKFDQDIDITGGHGPYNVYMMCSDVGLQLRTITSKDGDGFYVFESPIGTIEPGNVWMITEADIMPRLFRCISNVEVSYGTYEITAMLHDPNKFARIELDLAFDARKTSLLPAIATCKPPGTITITQTVITNPDKTSINLEISWGNSPDPLIRGYAGKWRQNNGSWHDITETPDTSCVLRDVTAGTYTIQIIAINKGAVRSSARSATYVIPDELPTNQMKVYGLELFEQGNVTNFVGADAKFAWRVNSPAASSELGDERFGSDSGQQDFYFRDYEVRIYDVGTGVAVRKENVLDPAYIYTFEKNKEDGGPRRQFKIVVYARDKYNQLSKPATLTVTNPAPILPNDLQIRPGVGVFYVTFTKPSDSDFAGALVWMSTTDGFTRSLANLAYQGPDNYITIQAPNDQVQFFRVAMYDAFGTDALNVSTQFSGQPDLVFDTVAPDTPTGLALTSEVNISADGAATVLLKIDWDASTAIDIASYVVAIKEDAGNFINFVAGSNQYTIIARPAILYTVKIAARDFSGNQSTFSSTSTHTPDGDTVAPGVPTGLSVTASFKNFFLGWTSPSDEDFDHVEIWESATNSRAAATHTLDAGGTGIALSGYATGATRYFWLKSVDRSGNVSAFNAGTGATGTGATLVGTATADYQNLSIVNAAIDNLAVDDAKIASLSAAKLVAGTVIAGTVLIAGGQSISTVAAVTADPATKINAGFVAISPGLVTISGATRLSDWQQSGDTTKIAGGAISANTILANKIEIGVRGVSIDGLQFTPTGVGSNNIAWSAGNVNYVDDTGTAQQIAVSAGSTTYSSGTLYLIWGKGNSTISTTTSLSAASSSSNIILATYKGGVDLVVTYGRTVVDGSHIIAGSITATQITASTITANEIVANGITHTYTANAVAGGGPPNNNITSGGSGGTDVVIVSGVVLPSTMDVHVAACADISYIFNTAPVGNNGGVSASLHYSSNGGASWTLIQSFFGTQYNHVPVNFAHTTAVAYVRTVNLGAGTYSFKLNLGATLATAGDNPTWFTANIRADVFKR